MLEAFASAARSRLTVRTVAVYSLLIAVLGVAFDASLGTIVGLAIGVLLVEIADGLREEPDVNGDAVTLAIGALGTAAMVGLIVWDGAHPFLFALLLGALWLVYDGASGLRSESDAATDGEGPS